MYVGRLLVAGPGLVAYRVSSRSFPNRRTAVRADGTVAVVPGEEADPEPENPYVQYNCLRVVETDGERSDGSDTASEGGSVPVVVAGNGSHVDPTAEKLARGYPRRDALVAALHALDYEKDQHDTPRIGAAVGQESAVVGVVTRDALVVERVDEPTLVATYEEPRPTPFEFTAGSGADAAREAYRLDFERPVCAVGATMDGSVDVGTYNGE